MKKLIVIGMLLALLLCGCAAKTPEAIPTQAPTQAPTAAPVLREWPESLDSLPAFTEYDSFEYAGQTANGWEISLLCSLEQLEDWRTRVQELGTVHGEFSVFHNGEYVVQVDESYATTAENGLLRVRFYLTEVKEQVWPEELSDFPVYDGEGAVISAFAVDTQYIENWTILEATFYGETQEGLDAYLEELVAAGFELQETEDGESYLRLRGDLADQLAYEFSDEAIVTVTWAICPAADLVEE